MWFAKFNLYLFTRVTRLNFDTNRSTTKLNFLPKFPSTYVHTWYINTMVHMLREILAGNLIWWYCDWYQNSLIKICQSVIFKLIEA